MEKNEKILELYNELGKLTPSFVKLEDSSVTLANKRFSMSALYAEQKGSREFFKDALKTQRFAMGDATSLLEIGIAKGKIAILEEILRTSKQCFDESSKLSSSIKDTDLQ